MLVLFKSVRIHWSSVSQVFIYSSLLWSVIQRSLEDVKISQSNTTGRNQHTCFSTRSQRQKRQRNTCWHSHTALTMKQNLSWTWTWEASHASAGHLCPLDVKQRLISWRSRQAKNKSSWNQCSSVDVNASVWFPPWAVYLLPSPSATRGLIE